jgi:hypothetical protein
MSAALAARDLKNFLHGDATDVAAGHEFVVFRDDEQAAFFKSAADLRQRNARQAQLAREPIDGPSGPAVHMTARHEVHRFERELLHLRA